METKLNCNNGRDSARKFGREFALLRRRAITGHVDAMYAVGMCYKHGEGVAADKTEAFRFLTSAAELGHMDAQYHLAFCYYYGDGIIKDPSKAVFWFKKSSEQNHPDAQANLGLCYEDGDGVEKDLSKALYYYSRAAHKGNMYALDLYAILDSKLKSKADSKTPFIYEIREEDGIFTLV